MGPSVTTFGAMRMAVGGSSWLAPRLSGRLFGLGDAAHPVVTRLFGVRDVMLGAALLDGTVGRRRALQAGVVVDAVDAAATVIAVRRGDIGLRGAVLIGGGAALFAALGVMALREERTAVDRP